jgi:MFS family permease
MNGGAIETPIPDDRRPWVNRAVLGIVLATFFSDFSHETATSVLPLYLGTLGLGAAALGMIEGFADFLVSLSKLAGGVAGHHIQRKRPLVSLGYLVTSLATAGLGLAKGVAALVSLRSVAWISRGFRSPMRDHLLADAVEPTHYGRAFGLERAGDMLGAVAGPLMATLLIWAGIPFRTVILWTVVPGVLAAASMFFLTREVEPTRDPAIGAPSAVAKPPFPPTFWRFMIGVSLFGLGDFSRTFLVLLASYGLGESTRSAAAGAVSVAVLLYAMHNLISAVVAYPIGHIADRTSKVRVLILGYGLGVGTNVILAIFGGNLGWLIVAIVLSAIYIAVEETLEKAVLAGWLPTERRSLGLGYLACFNAVGDMVSSLYVGSLLQAGRPGVAFGLAAVAGGLGVLWLSVLTSSKAQRARNLPPSP